MSGAADHAVIKALEGQIDKLTQGVSRLESEIERLTRLLEKARQKVGTEDMTSGQRIWQWGKGSFDVIHLLLVAILVFIEVRGKGIIGWLKNAWKSRRQSSSVRKEEALKEPTKETQQDSSEQ